MLLRSSSCWYRTVSRFPQCSKWSPSLIFPSSTSNIIYAPTKSGLRLNTMRAMLYHTSQCLSHSDSSDNAEDRSVIHQKRKSKPKRKRKPRKHPPNPEFAVPVSMPENMYKVDDRTKVNKDPILEKACVIDDTLIINSSDGTSNITHLKHVTNQSNQILLSTSQPITMKRASIQVFDEYITYIYKGQ